MMKTQNYISKNALIVIAMTLLSGCACLYTSSFSQNQETQLNLARQCEQADVLVTDLMDASPNRAYVLPSGQVCQAKE